MAMPTPTPKTQRRVDVEIPGARSDGNPLKLCVFEAISEDSRDTYGSRLWPAAVHLATYLTEMQEELAGKTVLELGCGNGLCSLAASALGAQVVATDYRQKPFDLMAQAAKSGEIPVPQQQVLDFAAPMPAPLVMSRPNRQDAVLPPIARLPKHDVLIAADVGYSKSLAWRLGERCRDSLLHGKRILICESRQMPECRIAFREALNIGRPPGREPLRLEKRGMTSVTPDAEGVESVPYVWFLDAQDH
eukprot:symbB.v1.2.007879.t1/scaffold482.1/size381469/7